MRTYTLILIIFMVYACNSKVETVPSDPEDCTVYACPMHPDKTSTEPARCPECNMEMKIVPDSIPDDTNVAGKKHHSENDHVH